MACSCSGWCLSINGWKWRLLRARILGDEAQLQLGEDTNVVKHQPKLHWSLSISLLRNATSACRRGMKRVSQAPSMHTEVRTGFCRKQREMEGQCASRLSRGLAKCDSKKLGSPMSLSNIGSHIQERSLSWSLRRESNI